MTLQKTKKPKLRPDIKNQSGFGMIKVITAQVPPDFDVSTTLKRETIESARIIGKPSIRSP